MLQKTVSEAPKDDLVTVRDSAGKLFGEIRGSGRILSYGGPTQEIPRPLALE